MPATADDIAAALRRYAFRFVDEAELQRGVEGALAAAGFDARSEVILGAAGRPDFVVDRVAVEVKVASSPAVVGRQIARYAAHDDIDEVVVVTSRVAHRVLASDDPPVRVVVVGAGL